MTSLAREQNLMVGVGTGSSLLYSAYRKMIAVNMVFVKRFGAKNRPFKVEQDLKRKNLGMICPAQSLRSRPVVTQVVETATLQRGHAT